MLFYVYFFWPVIQEALVHKSICIRIFLAVFFVFVVFPAWKGLARDRCTSHSLTAVLGLHTFPWPLTKNSKPLPFTFSLESPILVSTLTTLWHAFISVLYLHLLSVSPLECTFHETKILFCSPECLKQMCVDSYNKYMMNECIYKFKGMSYINMY